MYITNVCFDDVDDEELKKLFIQYNTTQWWASYFLKVTSFKLQLLGKKVTKLKLQI